MIVRLVKVGRSDGWLVTAPHSKGPSNTADQLRRQCANAHEAPPPILRRVAPRGAVSCIRLFGVLFAPYMSTISAAPVSRTHLAIWST